MAAKNLTWILTQKKFPTGPGPTMMKMWLGDLLKQSKVDLTKFFGSDEPVPVTGKKYVVAVHESEFKKIKKVLAGNNAPTVSKKNMKFDIYWTPVSANTMSAAKEFLLLLIDSKTNKEIIKIHLKTTGLSPHDPKAKKKVSDKIKINTAQQELISLRIFKAVLDKNTPDWKSFESMYDDKKSGLKNIHSGLKVHNYKENDWWKHFDLQFNELRKSAEKGSGLKVAHYEVYNRDGTGVSDHHNFMDWISALITKGTDGSLDKEEIKKFGKKDSWDPADIWLIDTTGGAYDKVKTELSAATTIAKINAIMIKAFDDRVIKGISLKKNRGGKNQLMWEEVNLYKSRQKQKLPKVVIKTIEFDPHYQKSTKSFSSVTSTISFTDESNTSSTYKLSFRSNQSHMTDITYEFGEVGMPAQLGKIPKDRFDKALSEMPAGIPRQYPKLDDHTNFDKSHWNKVHKIVSPFLKKYDWKISLGSRSALKYKMTWPEYQKQMKKERGIGFKPTREQYKQALMKKTDENKDVAWKGFVINMEDSWRGGKKKGNSVMMQMVDFIYLLAVMENKLKKTGFQEFMTNIFYWAQKKGQVWEFGPFAKSY